LVVQPVIRLIEIVVSVVEYVLLQICRLVQELVNVLTQVLKYICTTVVRTVCNAVCSVICGICDFFCGIFGCDCGCRNVCNNVCKAVTDVVCGWTYVLEWVLQLITKVICDYIVRALIVLLHLVEAIVTLVLTWVCSLIDIFIRWLLCWTYLAEIFNNRKPRRFKDEGRPLAPVVDLESGKLAYFEVATRGDTITGRLRRRDHGEELVPGRPFLYYPFKVMEIASHLFGDIFAGTPADDGRGTAPENNLLTYRPNVQALAGRRREAADEQLQRLAGEVHEPSLEHLLRRPVDLRHGPPCRHGLDVRPPHEHLIHGDIGLTAGDTDLAEGMSCGPSQTLTFEQTNFLMRNKDADGSAVTTYFVSRYDADDSSVGCNDLLGYTVVTFSGGDQLLFVSMKVLPYAADTNRMMARIVENVSARSPAVVRVAETYLHECGHQCGLLHDEDAPDCENDTALHITKLMKPGGSVRRALTRIQWCLIRTSSYVTGADLPPFLQAAELPDSESVPPPPVP
jgi:hypothetical protein